MKRHSPLFALGLAVTVAPVLWGCRVAAPAPSMVAGHDAALAATTASRAVFAPDSVAEKAAVARFIDFYREYSTAQIQAGVRDLYAATAYFGDPFQAVTGIDAIETYFLKMAEPVENCIFDVDAFGRDDGEYYFRWVMRLTIRRAPDKPIAALGFSHVRFDDKGQVIFQQDYWDSSVLFERLPVVGGLTRFIKRRMER